MRFSSSTSDQPNRRFRELVGPRSDVHVFEGDCNNILFQDVFPKIRYENFRRGSCSRF